eukprot:UN13196
MTRLLKSKLRFHFLSLVRSLASLFNTSKPSASAFS